MTRRFTILAHDVDPTPSSIVLRGPSGEGRYTSLGLGPLAPVGQAMLTLNGPEEDGLRDTRTQTNGVNRWIVRYDDGAETGGDAGSNYLLLRRADNGGALGAAVTYNRATGEVTFDGRITQEADNTQDFGLTGASRLRSIFVGTSFLAPDGLVGTPSIAFAGATDTGLFRQSATAIRFAIGGVDQGGFESGSVANEMALVVRDFTGAALKRVRRGAAGSGGAGLRLLLIDD